MYDRICVKRSLREIRHVCFLQEAVMPGLETHSVGFGGQIPDLVPARSIFSRLNYLWMHHLIVS